MERDHSKTLERIWEAGFFLKKSNEDKDLGDEALSLCDLPISLIKRENPSFNYIKPKAIKDEDDREEFGFKYQPPPHMCSADEVFFQGQILPLRLSVSSDNSSAAFHRRESELLRKFKSINSSRSSSSSRSHYSSSSINNSITTTTTSSAAAAGRNFQPEPKVTNIFRSHSHPSPKPQIKSASSSSSGGRSQKISSSTWDFFRLGLVKTPGMELQDLKQRSSMKRNSDSRNNSVGSRVWIERKSGILMSGIGCNCSVETVTEAPRSGAGKITAEMMRMKKKMEKEKEEQEKLEMSRHRTFEWLRELSHASFPCEV